MLCAPKERRHLHKPVCGSSKQPPPQPGMRNRERRGRDALARSPFGASGPHTSGHREEGVSYLGRIRAGVLAVQHERDPGFFHFLLEEVLLGNPDHLRQLPKQDEGFETQQLALLWPRCTNAP